MMTKMTGTLTRVSDDEARVEVGPFEYQVLVSEAVRRQIQMRVGHDITFHIIEYYEGTPTGNRFTPRRIGFQSEQELELFELFCTVDKIGVKKALKAMARPVREIAAAVHRQDARWLSTLPGIGAAMAESIGQSLKRKILPFLTAPDEPVVVGAEPSTAVAAPLKKSRRKADAEPVPSPALPAGQLVDDIYQTLMAVGLNPVEAQNKLDELLRGGKPFANVEEALLLVYARG